MNKLALFLLMSLATAGAYAQGTSGDITTSTDPAKAAAVEKHAQELQAHQSKEANAKASSSKKSTAKTSSTHKSSSHASSTHKSTTHKSSTTKATTAPKS